MRETKITWFEPLKKEFRRTFSCIASYWCLFRVSTPVHNLAELKNFVIQSLYWRAFFKYRALTSKTDAVCQGWQHTNYSWTDGWQRLLWNNDWKEKGPQGLYASTTRAGMRLDNDDLLLNTCVCHEVPPGDPVHSASSFGSFRMREQHTRCNMQLSSVENFQDS